MSRAHRRVTEKDDAPPKTTAMIDVTFLLLVFFMLTVQFKTLEGALGAQLPKGVGPAPDPAAPEERVEIRIDVLAEGTRVAPDGSGAWSGRGPFTYGPDRVTRFAVGPWSTRDPRALGPRLRALRRLEPERRAVIDARPGTIYAEAVAALDAARAAGWREVGFAAAR